MRKILVVALYLALFALCACGQAEPETTTRATTIATTTEAPATTAEAPTRLPIKYPASYKDAPKAYKPVLDQFYYEAQPAYWENGEPCVIGGEYIGEPIFSQTGDLGYAIKDINNDGIPELLLLDMKSRDSWRDDAERPFIHALFTLKDGKPVQLGSYWRRNYITLAADGTMCSGGGLGFSVYKLNAQAAELTIIREIKNDYGAGIMFEGSWDGERKILTEEEYSRLNVEYTSNPMPLTFIPIAQ